MAKISDADINALNLKIRQTPFYQNWFRTQGLDQNRVQLSDPQRQQLTQELARNGMPLPEGTLVDKAGNVGKHHGFAGLPTWAKIALAAAPVAATAVFAPEAFTSMGSLFGVGGGGGATAAGTTAAAGGSTAATVGTTGAALALGKVGVDAVTGLYANHTQNSAARDAANIQANAANHSADLQAKSAEEALAFLKEQYAAREARMAPYRAAGQQAATTIGDLTRPGGNGRAYLPPPTVYTTGRDLVNRG